MRVVITGSSGSLARDVIPGLLAQGYDIHGIDRAAPEELVPVTEEPTDSASGRFTYAHLDLVSSPREDVLQAFSGADAIIHLAGIPLEDSWDNLARANIDATHLVCSAALETGVKRVVLASSMHATGLTPIPAAGERLEATIPVNPNTRYGVSKAAVEAIGSYFAEQHGLEVVALRICSRMTQPETVRHLSTWLSPADATTLCAAAVSGAMPAKYWTVWGVSNNDRNWFDTTAGQAIGFTPQDNAESFAAQLENLPGDRSAEYTTIGGEFSTSNPPSMN